jgi:hypothetical protein
MKLRTALSALTAVAIVASAPALALAQTPAATSGKTVSSTPVPNPPEKSKTVVKKQTAHHTKAKTSHRRHKAEATKPAASTSAKAPTTK